MKVTLFIECNARSNTTREPNTFCWMSGNGIMRRKISDPGFSQFRNRIAQYVGFSIQ